MKSDILVILGMHRSGTSLTSAWLHSCGLNIGSYVSGKGLANSKGFFEDKDFLNFHEEILQYNGKDYLVTENEMIEMDDYHCAKIKNIISFKNSLNKQWGWKEPRTCLFVNNVYKKIIPNAKYLIVLRSYKNVVDSLYRRELKIIKSRINFPRGYHQLYQLYQNKNELINIYLSTWIRYNTEILKLVSSIYDDNFIIVTSDTIINNDRKVYDYIINWGFNLNYESIDKIYESKMFSDSNKIKYSFDEEKLKIADDLYQNLLTFQKQFK